MNFEKPPMPAKSESEKTPDNYQDKLENLTMMKEAGVGTYHTAVNELMNLANGDDFDGIGEQYYAGWSKEDFARLLKDLGEDE